MVHGGLRVAAVYVSGVLAGGPGGCHAYDVDGDDDDDDVERNNCNICNQGSLWTSILKPGVFLSGASGGVYALITGEIFMFVIINIFLEIFLNNLFQFTSFSLSLGHLATLIMNHREMSYPWQVFPLSSPLPSPSRSLNSMSMTVTSS